MRVLGTALLFTSIASRTFGFNNPNLLKRSAGIIHRGLTMQNSDVSLISQLFYKNLLIFIYLFLLLFVFVILMILFLFCY